MKDVSPSQTFNVTIIRLTSMYSSKSSTASVLTVTLLTLSLTIFCPTSTANSTCFSISANNEPLPTAELGPNAKNKLGNSSTQTARYVRGCGVHYEERRVSLRPMIGKGNWNVVSYPVAQMRTSRACCVPLTSSRPVSVIRLMFVGTKST